MLKHSPTTDDNEVPGLPFAAYLGSVRGRYVPPGSPLEFVPRNELDEIILRVAGQVLVYLLNEKRIEGSLQGNSPEERYEYFEQESTAVACEIEKRFPEIAADLDEKMQSLEGLCSRIVAAVAADAHELAAAGILSNTIARVVSISPRGDLHAGEAVCMVLTDAGATYFKPRGVANEEFLERFEKLVLILSADSLADDPEHGMKWLQRSTHGWASALVPIALTDRDTAHGYYKAMGRLLFVAYVLNVTDLHYENVIAVGARPFIIDAETVFSTALRTPLFPDHATRTAANIVYRSVAATALLPMGTGFSVYGGDISGIAGGEFRTERRVLSNPGRDDLRYVKAIVASTERDHLPFVVADDIPEFIRPHAYTEDIIQGFVASYDTVLNNIPRVREFIRQEGANVRTRLLARKTNDYSVLLNATRSVSNLHRSDQLVAKLHEHSLGLPSSLVDSEIRQVKGGDIPLFTCLVDSRIVQDDVMDDVATLADTPIEESFRTLARMNATDLDLQLRIIRFSLQGQELLRATSDDRVKYRRKLPSERPSVLRNAMESIVDEIERDKESAETDGSVNWLSLGVDDADQLQLEPMNASLYNGTTGMGMAAISYFQETTSSRPLTLLHSLESTVLRAYRSSHQSPEGLMSYYNGQLGQLAFLTRLTTANLAVEPIDVDLEIDLFAQRCVNFSAADETFDVIDGAAGAILALHSVPQNPIRTLAIGVLAEHLLSNAKKGLLGLYWDLGSRPRQHNASFAHGNGGIASAFLAAAEVTGTTRYVDAWRTSWRFEQQFRIDGMWRDTRRDDGRSSANWCHGTTGIALSRNLWLTIDDVSGNLKHDERVEVQKELDEALLATASNGLTINNFCMCHGVVGNLAAIQECAFQTGSTHGVDIRGELESVARFGLDETWLCGLGSHFNSYGLMTGMAGILEGLTAELGAKPSRGVLTPRLWAR